MKESIFMILMLVVVMVLSSVYLYWKISNQPQSFAECATASGSKILEQNPRLCISITGKKFVDQVQLPLTQPSVSPANQVPVSF
jgi:hypothetical protein